MLLELMKLVKFIQPLEFWRNFLGFLIRKKNSNNGNNYKDILNAFSAELVFISVRISTISYDGKIKNYRTETDDFSHFLMCLSNIAPHKCVHIIPDLCLIAIQVCSVLLLSDLYFVSEKNTSEIVMKNKYGKRRNHHQRMRKEQLPISE